MTPRSLLLVGTVALPLWTLLACGSPEGGPSAADEAADRAADEGAAVVVLARADDLVLDLPPHSRPHAPVPPERVPLRKWRMVRGTPTTDNPIRPRNSYFFRPPPGMRVLTSDGVEVPHEWFARGGPDGRDAVRWAYDADTIELRGLSSPPPDGAYVLEYPKATEREAALNLAASGKAPADFARTTVQAGPSAFSGLLLPAPARAEWRLTVPKRAELRFSAGLVEPELRDAESSDGALVRVELEADGETKELWRGRVAHRFDPVRVDLSAWEGRQVTLRALTDPAGDPRFDYVFLADPVVATRKRDPKRVVLVFVDTLRPDHLSAYGYHRPTSPALEKVAAAGARFTAARSIAPWTLPSARTMLTGAQPEHYFDARTVADRFAEAGYATAMFAGNMYLSAHFGIERDWGTHFMELLPRGEDQVDRALAWLEAQEGRDAFVLLHLMDAHLPYKEPESYRRMFAGDPPAALPNPRFDRPTVVRARLRDEADRQYVRDRYDNTIRYADDQLARLYGVLEPDDVLVFLSDHGEEFWDHGGYEHGHALWDEILRIPLVIRAPGVPAGAVVDAPVSMLDVVPTLLDLAGLPLDDWDSDARYAGTSLVPAARGDATALASLRARDQAFGRPLYGRERWGVLHGDLKYTTDGGRELVHDVARDPGEERPLRRDEAQVAELRQRMGDVLRREVAVGYRISPQARQRVLDDLVVTLTVPGGVKAAWVGDDPTESSMARVEWTPGEETVVATWPAPWRGSRDVWVIPVRPIAEVTHELSAVARAGAAASTVTVPADKPADLNGRAVVLVDVTTGTRPWELGFGVSPLPGTGRAVVGRNDDVTAELEALGYVMEDAPAEKPAEQASRQ